MNFLQKIKNNLNDHRNQYGQREQVLVDARALRALVNHYEVLDTAERALHPGSRGLDIEHQLHNLIEAAYQRQGKNAETTLMLIMDTLRPLMEQRHKEQQIIGRLVR